MKRKVFILILFLTPAWSYAVLYRPFGIRRTQPPRMNSITIVDEKIGVAAKQVCGYTDWTTAQVHLPKKLLSKTYWNNLGQRVVDEAKKTVLSLSGALPGMIACNVSPTFCHLMNQSELMAAFETQLTFDSCQVLEGVANIGQLQSVTLANCVKRLMNEKKDLTAGQAREQCLINQNGELSKEDKNATIAANGGDEGVFNMDKFLMDIFPEKVQTTTGYIYFEKEHRYSRRTSTYRLMKTLFPGVTVSSRLMTVSAGTFQPTIDKEYNREADEIYHEIIIIMREMKKYYDKELSDIEIIERSSKIWRDPKRWEKEKKLPPIYREGAEGEEPVLLVPPEQILELVPLLNKNPEDSDLIKNLVDQMAKLTANVKLGDRLSDAYSATLDKCKRDPKYQDAVSQKNCDLMLDHLTGSMNILEQKRRNEENVRKLQREIHEFVGEELQIIRRSQKNVHGRDLPRAPVAPIGAQ